MADVEDDRPCQKKSIEKSFAEFSFAREWSVSLTKDRAIRVLIPSDPVFDQGSAQFKPQSLLPLQRLATALTACDQAAIHILTYADGANGDSLSERRALAVFEYLERQEVPAARMRKEGRGSGGKSGQHFRHRIELMIKPIDPARPDIAWASPTD